MKNFAAAIMLAIGAYAAEEKSLTGGELQSLNTFKYGKFVASMKPSMLKGTGSAFYLYGLDKEETNVFDEWNAMVIVPSLKEKAIASRMNFTYLQEDWLTHDFIGDRDDYHTYEIEWTPDYLAYKVDGTEIRRRSEVQELWTHNYNLVMSIMALKDNEVGNVDPEELPTYTEFDYVEVYSYDEVEKNFHLNFRDDFDQFDDELWEKADHYTWGAVASTAMEENITYKDGHLRLKLDKIARDPEDPDDDKSDDDKPDEESEDEESNDDEHSEEEDEDEHSGHESEEENDDFHVLPAPKDGSLDRSIEKATRVALVMVRTYLEDWSDNMAHYLKM